MRHFLHTVLEKDQRVLLKLKKHKLIESADDENKKSNLEYHKHTNTELLVDRYVE